MDAHGLARRLHVVMGIATTNARMLTGIFTVAHCTVHALLFRALACPQQA